MASCSWKSLICGVLAAALAVPATADDLADLKVRLEAIEAENAKLREDLDAVKTSEDVLVGQMSKLSDSVDKKEDAKDPKKEDPLSFSSKWNNGWEASTKDKQFKNYFSYPCLQFCVVVNHMTTHNGGRHGGLTPSRSPGRTL